MNEKTALNRNTGIDFLRGLAIFLVITHHVGIRISLHDGILASFLPKWFLNTIMFAGYEGVFIFFVISGFLITMNTLLRSGHLNKINVPNFYIRRAARILPCLFILVTVLSLLHLFGINHYVIKESQNLFKAIFSALTFHLNWYEGSTGYLPAGWDVLWSLSIEEVFYLCFPLVCLTLRKNWMLIIFLTLFTFSLPFSKSMIIGNAIWQEKAYLPGMAAIATGVLGALLAFRKQTIRMQYSLLLLLLGSLGLIVSLCFGRFVWHLFGHGNMLVLTFSTLCLLLAFYGKQAEGKMWSIFNVRWLCSFGRLSYEIYLTHVFVMWWVVDLSQSIHLGRWSFIWYISALILSWCLGWIVSKTISIPCEKRLRFALQNKMNSKIKSAVPEGVV